MKIRLDTEGKHDVILRAFQKSSEQVGKIGDLVESLMQHRIPQLECLQSFLKDFKEADVPRRLEQRNTDWILRTLEFEGMDARRNQVESTVGNTFKWLIANDDVPKDHPELQVSLKTWLSAGAGVYHVTGKPGSGKSTLMKLIDQDAESRQQLETWASRTGDRLIVARFYTWKAANAHRLQNQEEGLTRTLLHQILTAAPELTQVAFAKHPCWNPQEHRLVDHLSRSQGMSAAIRLEPEEILTALESLFRVEGYRFFLLIDGMDEFEKAHKHRAIAERVLQWGSGDLQRAKACVSSREENAFMGKFSADQRLRLHVVTASDIHQLVDSRLMEHDHFREASQHDRQDLVCKLVDKAEGVFLWVVLTIHELKILMDDCQSFRGLLQEVDRIPNEMEDFLREILSRIPEAYKEESRAIFSVATTDLAKGGSLNLFHYSMLRRCIENNDSDAVQSSAMSFSEAVSQMKEFRSRLPSLCKGLLETAYGTDFGLLYGDMSDEDRKSTLQCSHRSVLDFLRHLFINAPVAVDSQIPSETQGMLLAVHSVIEVTKAIPWERTSYLRELKRHVHLIELLTSIQREMLLKAQLGDLIFPLLRTLDAILLRNQGAVTATVPFNSKTPVDVNFDLDPITVFSTALRQDFCDYIQWASENYPPSFLTREAKSCIAIPTFVQRISPLFIGRPHTIPVRCLTEGSWLSINEPLPSRRDAFPSALQLQQASMWVSILLVYILDYRHTRFLRRFDFHGNLVAGLAAGAEARIRFKWWSQTDSACPHRCSDPEAVLVLKKPTSSDRMSFEPIKESQREESPFGSDFGVTIEVGDTSEPELIQGPRPHEPGRTVEEDTQLIHFFVGYFQRDSGTATLRDVVEVLLEPDMTRCPYTGDKRASWYEEESELQRQCLEAIDDALSRVGTLPLIDTEGDLRAPKGRNEVRGDLDKGESDYQPSRSYWLSIRNYLHDCQTVTIFSLGKTQTCHSRF